MDAESRVPVAAEHAPQLCEEPRVSVVMGVYNGEAALRPTMESVLTQDEVTFEFVIVNDGSTDSSLAMLQEYAVRDARVRVIDQENRGLTWALRAGCEVARGRYIARQDVGDLSLPGRLRKLADMLDGQPDVAAMCSLVEQRAPGGELIEVVGGPADASEATRLLVDEGRAPIHTATMFRRQAYVAAGGYRPEFRMAQDHDLWYRLIDHGLLAYLQEPLFCWVLDETGVTASSRKRQQRFGELARASYFARKRGESEAAYLREATELGMAAQQRKATLREKSRSIAATNYFIGACLLARGDAGCERYLARALQHEPWDWKCWLKWLWALVQHGRSSPMSNRTVPVGGGD